MSKKTIYLVQGGIIAAIYAALTILLAPISYSGFQVRIAEALTILPYFTPAAIPGLFVGCFTANLLSPVGVWDVIFGSLATLIAAILSYKLRKYPLLVPIPPIIINGLIVGATLSIVYTIPMVLIIFQVTIGQLVACYLLGYPLLLLLERYKNKIFK